MAGTSRIAPKNTRRKAGRPTVAVLTTASITTAALKLVNVSGYRGLTMASLAESLGVAPSALYNHVRSKEDVLALVQDYVMGEVDVSGFGTLPWQEAVARWARSYRDIFAVHTPLIPIIALQPVKDSPQTLAMYEAVTNGLIEAGWVISEIVDAIVALESFIFGSAYDVNSVPEIFDSNPGQAPAFERAVAARRRAEGENGADSAFDVGLTALLTSLRLAQRRTPLAADGRIQE